MSCASAKAGAKAREAEQIHQQTIKSVADAELKIKQAEQEKKAAVAEAIAKAEAKAEDDLIAAREEDARVAAVNQDEAVQAAITKQKRATSSNSTTVTNAPIISTPTTPIPVTSGAVESSIDGTFNGWTGDTIFKLRNGQIWKQSSYAYMYHYAYSPEVTIYQSNTVYKMT